MKSKIINFIKSRNAQQIALIAFLLSFSFSPWLYYPWRIINSDGVLYLQLAYQVNTQGIFQTFTHYNWPFFSILIASVNQFFHLSYVNAALLLEGIFIGFTALFYIKIIEKLGGNKITQWLAILVFLSFETIINYRGNIFRDFGYWAFFLSAFYFMLEYASAPSIKNGLFWFFSALIALLFRIEGIAVFLIFPFVVFFFQNFSFQQKLFAYLKLYLPIIVLLVCVLILAPFHYLVIKAKALTILDDGIRLITTHWGNSSFFYQLQSAIWKFQHWILPKTAKDGSAFLILFIGMTGYFICKLIWTLGGLNFLLAISTWIRKAVPFKKNQKLIFYWLLFITFFISYNFLLERQFISTRYLLTSSLVVLLLAPFSLNYCVTHLSLPLQALFIRKYNNIASSKKFLTLKSFLILYLIFALGDFIFLGVTLFYSASLQDRHANIWLYNNRNQLPNFCSPDSWLLFAVVGEKIPDNKIDPPLNSLLGNNNCQYIGFVLKPKRADTFNILQSSPDWVLLKAFPDHHRNRNIYIFARKKA